MVSNNYKDFNCSQCNEYKQKDRGCIEDAPIPRRWQIGKDIYQRCPRNLVSPLTWFSIRVYQQYQSGFLPTAGGILDQSNLFLQIIEIIQAEMSNGNNN